MAKWEYLLISPHHLESMKSEPDISKKGLILVAVPLVFELIFVSVLVFLLIQTEKEVEREAYARRVNSQANKVSQHMLDFMVGVAGYSMTKDSTFAYHYNTAVKKMPQAIDGLIELLKDQPGKQESAIKIKKKFDYGVRLADRTRITFENGETEAAIALLPELKQLSMEGSMRLHDIAEDERLVELKSPEIQAQLRESLHLCLIIGVLFNVGICFALANYFSRTIVNRINTMLENSSRLALDRDLLPPVHGSDELAVLDSSFHKMADTLRMATRRERALIHNAKEIICSINREGKLISTNNAAVNAWGYSPEELEGKRLSSIVSPEDTTAFNTILESSPDRESSFEKEICIRKKDGSPGDFVWSVQWSPEEEEFFCVVYDITERKRAESLIKEAEQRFRAIVNNIPTGLAACTETGQVEMINPALADMFKLENNEIVGKSISTLFHAGKSNTAPGASLQFVPADLVGQPIKCQAVKSSGQSFPVELSCHRIETGRGERFIVLIVDISDKEEIERLKQEFIMILSHELRSPLTSLKLLLTLLGENAYGELNDKGHQKVLNAEKNIGRLVRLIQELLDFESLESDRLKVEKRRISLAVLIEKSVEAVSGTAGSAGISISTECTDCRLMGDEDRLSQVIINLLANAVKYSPKDGEVRIEAQPLAEGEVKQVIVRVIDNGPGIKDEHKKLIFERFKQVDPSDRSGKGNVGLGLAIAKAIIEKHGGTIGVDSVEGRGSTFWFNIPRIID